MFGELSPLAAPRIARLRETPVDLDREWARSGAMAITGWPARPLLAPPELTAALLRIGDWIAALGDVSVEPLEMLAARAALTGRGRRGDISYGGHTRLLRCGDEWVGVTLARPEDIDAVPAWLELSAQSVTWTEIARAVRLRAAGEVEARARLLGLPAARLGSVRRGHGPAVRARQVGRRLGRSTDTAMAGALVVDLSSLWAGPVCAGVLQAAGARVVKVESLTRPDGTRAYAEFFDLLHSGQESVVLDFNSPTGRAHLRDLLYAADVVIESSRPRALRQLGIDCNDTLLHGRPSLWISITGYGSEGDEGNWVALGDDAAVAGGLVAWDARRPCFCGDAIADPATGLIAAAAAFAAWPEGCWKVDVALARVAAALAADRADWRTSPAGEVTSPRARRANSPAPTLGRDTSTLLEEIGGGARRMRCAAHRPLERVST